MPSFLHSRVFITAVSAFPRHHDGVFANARWWLFVNCPIPAKCLSATSFRGLLLFGLFGLSELVLSDDDALFLFPLLSNLVRELHALHAKLLQHSRGCFAGLMD